MPRTTRCETFFARDRETWRSWLAENHTSKTEIWLVLFKKHVDEPCISYDAAVEEALCFGWIDGKLRRIDDRKHQIRFTPRKPRSIWSESNKKRVKQLTAEGRMTEAGLALVREAKKSGAWKRASEKRTETVPPDLEAALARNKRAKKNFESFAPGYRRSYIAWVLDAKREVTRQRRIREVVKRSAQNKRPGIDM
jgi:uncharacterized protein YdeI (YjbR/CyaY-like superfamily)